MNTSFVDNSTFFINLPIKATKKIFQYLRKKDFCTIASLNRIHALKILEAFKEIYEIPFLQIPKPDQNNFYGKIIKLIKVKIDESSNNQSRVNVKVYGTHYDMYKDMELEFYRDEQTKSKNTNLQSPNSNYRQHNGWQTDFFNEYVYQPLGIPNSTSFNQYPERNFGNRENTFFYTNNIEKQINALFSIPKSNYRDRKLQELTETLITSNKFEKLFDLIEVLDSQDKRLVLNHALLNMKSDSKFLDQMAIIEMMLQDIPSNDMSKKPNLKEEIEQDPPRFNSKPKKSNWEEDFSLNSPIGNKFGMESTMTLSQNKSASKAKMFNASKIENEKHPNKNEGKYSQKSAENLMIEGSLKKLEFENAVDFIRSSKCFENLEKENLLRQILLMLSDNIQKVSKSRLNKIITKINQLIIDLPNNYNVRVSIKILVNILESLNLDFKNDISLLKMLIIDEGKESLTFRPEQTKKSKVNSKEEVEVLPVVLSKKSKVNSKEEVEVLPVGLSKKSEISSKTDTSSSKLEDKPKLNLYDDFVMIDNFQTENRQNFQGKEQPSKNYKVSVEDIKVNENLP